MNTPDNPDVTANPTAPAASSGATGSAIWMSFTQENLQNRAKEYVTRLYGKPGQGNDEDKWMERFGLLVAFIDDQFSQNNQAQAQRELT